MNTARESLEKNIRVTNWFIIARRTVLSVALLSCFGVAIADYQHEFEVNTPAILLGATGAIALVADVLLARGAAYLQRARPYFEERVRNE